LSPSIAQPATHPTEQLPETSALSRAISRPHRLWNPRSIALIVLAWLVLHIGCLFTPGLLDDVDSVYIEIAREMLLRRDFVTPYVDGIRFFDKPPLMYWLASGSMAVFGKSDWAGRLPLALLTLALLLATYALALRLFAGVSPPTSPDRAALYSALALATSIGPYLYTRFYIPDVVVALWLTLAIHAFLVALERIQARIAAKPGAPFMAQPHRDMSGIEQSPSALLPCLIFAAVTALNLLTKGFIGLVFPIAFVLLYLALTRQLRLLPKFHLIPSTLVFLAIAAPWHILAALRNPPIAMPASLGLPARAGWAWFYLYNEHIARFLSRRIPHDYGQVPIPLFWLLAAIWIFPWVAFLPGAIHFHLRTLRNSLGAPFIPLCGMSGEGANRTAALTLLLWAALVLGFFTLSARQEYYSLPALPALALMAGGLLAAADRESATNPAAPFPGGPFMERPSGRDMSGVEESPGAPFMRDCQDEHGWDPARSALFWHKWLLVPIGSVAAAIALFFAVTAPRPAPNTDIANLLAQGGAYNLSLGHLFDLTGAAMGLFRGPLVLFGLSMAAIGPLTYLLRRPRRNPRNTQAPAHTYAANLTLAAASACLLLSMHAGLVRFYPTLGSKPLADAILAAQQSEPPTPSQNLSIDPCASFVSDGRDEAHGWGSQPDLILIDGELTSGSTLLFYTRQPVHLVNGRINGPWFGSLWPDSPRIFEDDASLRALWAGPRRLFLLTYHPGQRTPDLARFATVRTLASSGGKTILTNR